MTGAEWADIISAGNDAFLRTYSTVTQKPIAQTYPTSVVDAIYGQRSQSAGIGGTGIVLVLAVVVGAVLIFRR